MERDGLVTDAERAAASLRVVGARGTPGRGRVQVAWEDLAGVPGGLLRLTLDHPSARHALSMTMMAEVGEAVLDLARACAAGRAPVAVVLQSSSPVSFCAGGDLVEVAGHLVEPELARAMTEGMAGALDVLGALPVVSLAVLEGPAIGGGLELALAADLVLMAESAWVEARQARWGVAAGWGGAPRLVRRAGAATALRVLALGERLSAHESLALGIADGVAPDPAQRVAAWLETLAVAGPEALGAVKRQVRASVAGEGPGAQAEAFLGVWGGRAHRERLARAAAGRGR